VLTLLCLLASFAYLTRQTETSTLGTMPGMSAAQMADMPGREQAFPAEVPAGTAGEHDHPAPPAEQSVSPTQVDLTTSAPNAPPVPADHNHAGHCPFCFTAAFALMAEGATLSVTFSRTAMQPEARYVRPLLTVFSHADARAPPSQA